MDEEITGKEAMDDKMIEKKVSSNEIIVNPAMDEEIIEKEVLAEKLIENPAMDVEIIEKEKSPEEIIETPAIGEEIIEKEIKAKKIIEKEIVDKQIMDEQIIEKDIMEKINTDSKAHNSVQQSSIGLGLNMIAQYDSDAENTNETESVPYRNQVVNINSDTDSDSSSDDSTCSEITEKKISLKREQKTLEKMLSDSDDDEDDTKGSKQRRQPKVKGELLLDDLPPIEDLHITVPEDECIVLGKVHSIVDQLALVSALPNSILVDLDTVLFLNKGKQVLGAVFDVLGQISEPLYCVRFNSNEQIKEKNINIGDIVYVAPKTEYTQFIILSSLLKVRGSDASWENDVEPPPRYLDYSDDEQERNARARARNKDRRPETENLVEQKRTAEDNESNASYDTRPTWRRQNPRGAGTSRGRGRGMHHAYNQHYAYPNAGSWHSNYYQAPPPPPPSHMYYGEPPQMRPIMPYPYPPRYPYNTTPAPPRTSYNDYNNM